LEIILGGPEGFQGCCALETETPPPMAAVILRRDNQPLGHPSCKQSKNQQEQEEQALNCQINMKVSILKHKMVRF
jgi:hypothetical protein